MFVDHKGRIDYTMMSKRYGMMNNRWLMHLSVVVLVVLQVYVNGQPVRSPSFGNLPCSICPLETDVVNNPDAVIPLGTLAGIPSITSDLTCAELEEDAANLSFRPFQCSYIINLSSVPKICGCGPAGATGAPVAVTTAAPVAVTTSAPTAAPVATTTAAPTSAPVATTSAAPTSAPVPSAPTAPVTSAAPAPSTPADISVANVTVTLTGLTSEIPSDAITDFESFMTSFLQDSIGEEVATDIEAALSGQELLGGESTNSTRFLRVRSLQTNVSTGPLEARLAVIGSPANASSWTSTVVNAINDNPTDIVAGLKFSNTAVFSPLESLSAAPTAPAPTESTNAPAPAPEPDSGSDGLSTGGIVGIVLGVIAVMLVAVLFGAANERKKKEQDERNRRIVEEKKSPPPSSSKPRKSVSVENMESKIVVAPPGKLGIVIDTTLQGPVIHQVKEGSPLQGKLSVGDIITDIDGTDTRAMTASAITTLMVEASDQERRITVLTRTGTQKSSVTAVRASSVGSMVGKTISTAGMVEKVIMAPAGKLGIVIDSTQQGPVVHTVRDDSPLKGKIAVGDVLVEVNGTDCSTMIASAVTKLMVDSADQERKLVVLTKTGTPSPAVTGSVVAVKKSISTAGMVRKVVIAPPGKLGIVIDSTQQGPVVHTVRDDSPLSGKLTVGDVLIEVNGTDCSTMTASVVTKLMVESAEQERTLVVLTKAETVSPALISSVVAVKKSVLTAGMVEKLVIAPAGKIGIVIDSTQQGPVVHTVRDESPLQGQILVGDIIVEVNGTSCRTMTASAVTKLMVESADQERKIVVLTKEITPPVVIEEEEIAVAAPVVATAAAVTTAAVVAESSAESTEPVEAIPETPTEPVVVTETTEEPVVTQVAEPEPDIPVSTLEPVAATEPETVPASEPAPATVPEPEPAPVTSTAAVAAATAATTTAAVTAATAAAEDSKESVVIAPPGKLGIVIDTTAAGPVVHKIKDGSPLVGKLKVGDVILDIDGTNTRSMSAAAITALMVKSAAKERKLTVLKKE